jgi:hypothetical protein
MGSQVFTDPQSSCWQQKIDSVLCAIKFFVFAALAIEAILTFLIGVRLRAAWAVLLNKLDFAANRVGFFVE